jgi:hypothetical protein
MSDHVDMVHPEIMTTMRADLDAAMRNAMGEQYDRQVEGMSDEQVLNYMDTGGYPGGAAGYVEDIGASV